MPTKTFLVLGCAALVAALLLAPSASAQPPDKRVIFTFSGPVAVPGMTLPAGKYMFRVMEPMSRNVVQVLSGDGTKHYTVFITIVAERAQPSQDPEIRFMETAVGMPATVKSWWYPGDRRGWEVIYPKKQARLLARGAGQPVLTTEAETTTAPETRVTELARISPAGQPVAVQFEQGPSTSAGPVLKGEIASSTLPVQEPDEAFPVLPATATATPLIALTGVVFLLAAVALRSWRVRRG